MLFKIISILFYVSILTSVVTFAQETPAKKDTTLLYKSIETYSKRSNFNRYIYQLIFKPVATKTTKKKVYKRLVQKSYKPFEGKIIRHINVETLDPFGYSVTDTTKKSSQDLLSKTGNKWHIKTQGITIRNLLLIRQNQLFDSLRVRESERLVRSQAYVHDVSFFVKAASKNSDSVDIYIRELDNWSITPEVEASPSSPTLKLTDKNFLGLGHEFQNSFTWNQTKGDNAYYINYFIPNIRNTYINSTAHYGSDQYGSFIKSFAVDRPFFSPLAKWAGGISVSSQFRKDSIKDINLLYVPLHLKFRTYDYWAGNAIRIFKGNEFVERVTNLILTARYLSVRYIEKPPELYDPYHIYNNEDFYLAGIGISTRRYVEDTYIFNFGLIEDVPVGRVYGLTGGYQVKNDSGRYYLGARISSGNYHTWGYFSYNLEYGTFFHKSVAEQGVITASANYFTGLLKIGKWRFRQFLKPQLTIGINRFPYDSLTLNKGYGLGGFNSLALRGTSRMVLTFQTQSYAPGNFLGFRFGPYFSYSLGKLGEAQTGFKYSKVYSQIGLGVIIKNDNFVFGTFQLSVSYYPIIPGRGEDIFKMNSFRTTDFGFMDFVIGKPSPLIYQ
jgi:hypothetical protein